MVSIVIVSHSAKLAEGVKELADQMAQGKATVITAGGIDDPENPIGTDAMRVLQAIESVYSQDGVVVMMDLGSALLSAEMALDFLDKDKRAHVRLCEAPLVEGTLAAAVQAAAGSDIDQVLAEARGALAVKVKQLQAQVPDIPTRMPGETAAPAAAVSDEIQLTVRNRLGIHARPAARFVSTASLFEAQINLRNITQDHGPVNAKSINQVATLGVRQGHQVGISAQGPDANEALAALTRLIEDNFGEKEGAEPTITPDLERAQAPMDRRPPPSASELRGVPASPGIAIGPVAIYRPTLPQVHEQKVKDTQAEWERLRQAISTAREEVQALRARAAEQVSDYEAAIFDAHALFLQDPAMIDDARQRISEQRINAQAAWQGTVEQVADTYRAMDDAYMQARAADVLDVGQRVLRVLLGVTAATFEPPEPSILVATDLTPSDTAQLDPDQVLGICTDLGGATSHSAILARGLGIPAVVGVGPQVSRLQDGTPLALNGDTGQVWVDPDPEKRAALLAQRDTWLEAQRVARKASQAPAITQDHHRVEIVANIRGSVDAQAALEAGAEGVGLLRTEFLYLDRKTAPTEEEQVKAYQAIAEVMGTRPLIARTLDVGGDKPLPYLDLGSEENPFLGWRAIRLGLDQPDILKTQLRAILRASPGHQFKIMFPMVATVGELKAAKAILAEAQDELDQANVPFDEQIEIGIMVEVPAAAVTADRLAAHVDFFSIGTNDLSQYTMAADRTNAKVAKLADAFQPAVLRLIRQTIQTAHEAGIWVGLCGELAGDPLAAPLLLGLGLDEFSMNAPAIPQVKQIIRQLTLSQAQALAEQALALDSAGEIRDLVKSHLAA